jgi:predicted nucleic acid-binding protein
MPAKAFFDTNVLIYAVAADDSRNAQAEELLASGGVLSVQILKIRTLSQRTITALLNNMRGRLTLTQTITTHWRPPLSVIGLLVLLR